MNGEEGGPQLKIRSRPLSFFELAKDLSVSRAPSADPLFGTAWAAVGVPRPARPWSLPVLNGVAAGAVIMGVAYRIWEAHLPSDVLRVEAILIGVGAVLAVAAVAVRSSRHSTSL